MRTPSFWRALWYLVLLAALTLVTVLYTLTWARGTAFKHHGWSLGDGWNTPLSHEDKTIVVGVADAELPAGMHPIEHLMNVATKQFEKMQKNQIRSLEQAAAQYRKLRGRHPPLAFDAWYEYAASHNAVVNERFWDQIYHDLAPFWSLDPTTLRKQAHVFSPKISIRKGKIEAKSYSNNGKMAMWIDMLTTLANDPKVDLPDMDIPLNINAEPAMLVPWEAIDTALSMSRKIMPEAKDTTGKFTSLDDIEDLMKQFDWKPEWLGPRLTHPASHLGPRPLWSLVRPACPPGSTARLGKVYNDIWDSEGGTREEHSAAALLLHDLPDGTLKGYVKNWTNTVDICEEPNLQGLHSAFVAPVEMGVATKLFPLFGDTKFAVGNEILLPGAADWNASALSTEFTALAWEKREDKLFWRGPATAGRDPKRYWQRFQSERLVSMMNATHVEIAEASIHTGNESTVGVGYAKNFRLLPANEYHLKTQTGGRLAEWVHSWADTALSDLGCEEKDKACDLVQEYFSAPPPSPSSKSSTAKFAVSIDSPSNPLITHLRQTRATLHASIYRNWFDTRLVPWLHFIPMDNTFVDLYGIIEYFIGSGSGNEPHVGHHSLKRAPNDDAAQHIAAASKSWAEKALRREDMLIYVYRLLLEYARVVDAKRDRLGWVGDLG
ncbi:hypothetical protein CC86DRAFT_278522 [Ophiobolus disseminans]|uniref:Glycosyl transferase CAP10 domain-containing protein n=1 Tax=Ophiobolus disseminans TaxID=1469910 RepID=A0A6A7ALJ9_9PLEO|nr:hypothetical protein CC86DRAFT_278522 [Ophiobolus disseminans]